MDGVLGLFTDWKYHLDHLTSCEVNKSWNGRIWRLEVSNQDDKQQGLKSGGPKIELRFPRLHSVLSNQLVLLGITGLNNQIKAN